MNNATNNAISRSFESTSQTMALPRPRLVPLPSEPVIKIRPATFWDKIDLAELWTHREVFFFLMWRDVKVRYKQTAIGVAWVVLQPILVTIVFAVFFGRLIRVPSDGLPYPVFVYASLSVWTFVSNAILSSSYSLVTNANIITRVFFPRMLIPASTIGVRLLDFLIASSVLIGLLIYYRVPITRTALVFPLFILMVVTLTVAIGLLTASLNVRYRDVGTILPILLQAWMFVSPVVYSSAIVPARLHFLYSLNPMVGIIDGFRASLFSLPFDWPSIILSAAIIIPFLMVSIHIFHRMESSFADDV